MCKGQVTYEKIDNLRDSSDRDLIRMPTTPVLFGHEQPDNLYDDRLSWYYSPSETTTTTTTSSNQPDSVVGATADAAGTIVEAPFRIVGDTLGILF